MGAAKVVSLSVRPLQASHLCFEIDGILGESDAQLGGQVFAFNFASFYAYLLSFPVDGGLFGDHSRLSFNFLELQSWVAPFTLVALRAEAAKAALNKAINARQNAYYAKYVNTQAIISQMNAYYSPSVDGSKPNRLANLSSLAGQQVIALQEAYTSDGRTGVVKTTGSVLESTTRSSERTKASGTTSGSVTETGQTNEEVLGLGERAGTFYPPPPGGQPFSGSWIGGASQDLEEGSSGESSQSSGSSKEKSATSGYASEFQTIVNTDYGYRLPYLECQAQYERAQISLIDQQFAQFMYGQNLPNLDQVFMNESNSIDSDVYRLQIAYLNTILLSPIAGTVTGIYKNPGDAVKAGEPVIRVENSDVILLVAVLVYRGPILIGSTVKVETALFDSSGPRTTVTGSVVSVRGRREDNQWEVIVKCNNLDGGGNPIFPLGYHFDFDDTTVSIT